MRVRDLQYETMRATRGVDSSARADAAYTHIKTQLLEGDYDPAHTVFDRPR